MSGELEGVPARPLICVIGPTASGKSSLGLQLAEALAPSHVVEFISMDSAQIYRGMDIGTAKPDQQVLRRHAHHLIDIRDPAERYSAAEFATDATQIIRQVHLRGHVPIVLGGTFLYMRALLQGLHEMPAADQALRRALDAEAAELGWPALHQRLAGLDPESARRIHPNDAQRIQRALEVAALGSKTRSEAWQQAAPVAWPGPVLKLALLPSSREALRADIARRFVLMMDAGFLDEVRQLFARPDLTVDLPAIRSVGYRQLWQHLAGELVLEEAVERAIIATRQYAKRQMTWLRGEEGLSVLPDTPVARLKIALDQVQEFLQHHGP